MRDRLTMRDLHDMLCEADCAGVVDDATQACDAWNCLRGARCLGLDEAAEALEREAEAAASPDTPMRRAFDVAGLRAAPDVVRALRRRHG